MAIMIAILALGFGLSAAIETIPQHEKIAVHAIYKKIEKSSSFQTTYERALQLLSQYPIVDGQVLYCYQNKF